MPKDDKQLSALERDMEATRERLADTIDQLVYRANPKTIVGRQVATVKAYYVDTATGQPRTVNILKTVGGVVGTVVALVVIRKIAA